MHHGSKNVAPMEYGMCLCALVNVLNVILSIVSVFVLLIPFEPLEIVSSLVTFSAFFDSSKEIVSKRNVDFAAQTDRKKV